MVLIEKTSVREIAKDCCLTIIKEYFNKLRFILKDAKIPPIERMNMPISKYNLMFLQPIEKVIEFWIAELLKDWKRLALEIKNEKEVGQRVELLKQLEGHASTTLFALETISQHELSFLQDLVQNDLVFGIMQLTDIDDSSVIALCVSYCEFFWRSFAHINNMIMLSSLVFAQTILKPLKRLEERSETQSDMTFRDFVDFKNLTSFLFYFIENKPLMRKLYLENDLNPFRSTIIDDIVNAIFKVKHLYYRT